MTYQLWQTQPTAHVQTTQRAEPPCLIFKSYLTFVLDWNFWSGIALIKRNKAIKHLVIIWSNEIHLKNRHKGSNNNFCLLLWEPCRPYLNNNNFCLHLRELCVPHLRRLLFFAHHIKARRPSAEKMLHQMSIWVVSERTVRSRCV